jgi:2-oxoisovalerate dehydrogenase E1 component
MIAQPESTIAELPGHVGAAAYPNIRAFESHPGDADAVSRQTLGRGLLVLSTIRLFEKWLIDNVSLVHGPLHSSIGQEAVAVGMGLALQPQDRVTATHRAHHHVLAKQLTYHMPAGFDPFLPGRLPEAAHIAVRRTLAEILGLADGLGGGRGGSMHLADFEAGVATTAIVGGGIPVASGLGLAAKLRGTGSVALTAFGDGAASIGAFHEGLSLARAWDLPVIFLLENNLYSVATTVRETTGFEDMAIRASGYDMPAIIVDGMDPIAVMSAIAAARAHAVANGPVLVEARTYRVYHHSGPLPGSAFRYRSKDEEKEWAGRDPFREFPRRLISDGLLSEADVAAILEQATELVDAAVAAATAHGHDGPTIAATAYPVLSSVYDGMRGTGLAGLSANVVESTCAVDSDEVTYGAAISEVTARWLDRDPDAFVIGLEVGHLGGGAFGATKGAVARFPDRVLSAPICENGHVGAALGAALVGMHPIVELMYPDFAIEAGDQLFNHVAKARYMYGGQHEVPVLVRTQTARGRGYGPQHSCDPAALFALFPGWRIVAPSTASDYVGLFNAAMLTRDPVLVIEDYRLSKLSAPLPRAGFDYVVPPGCARLVCGGTDVTVLSWSWALTRVMPIVDRLRARGLSVEVIDPRWLDKASFDRATVLESVSRTGALVIVEDAMRSHSMGPQILDYLMPDLFDSLRAAPSRVTGEDVFAPVSEPLETQVLLRDEAIETAVVAAAEASRRGRR